jgi:Flp pilus assembly protein TadG
MLRSRSRLRSGQTQERGQALVEFAFALPMFMMLVFVTIELGLVMVSYYSETRMARETARWLAVHSSATNDNELADHVRDTMLPGLAGGAWTSVQYGTASVPSRYTVGRMTVEFSPCLPNGSTAGTASAAAGSGTCTHANRVAGATLYVQMSYDVTPILFLQTNFQIGPLRTTLPTQLPVYKVSVMVE